MKFHTDIAYKELERLGKWVSNADVKASILLALNGGLLALLFSPGSDVIQENLLVPGDGALLYLLLLTFIAASTVSMYCSLKVLLPDVAIRSHRNLFFFSSVQQRSQEEFLAEFSALDEETSTVQILEQVHINSLIANNKFFYLGHSTRSLMVAIFLALAFMLVFLRI